MAKVLECYLCARPTAEWLRRTHRPDGDTLREYNLPLCDGCFERFIFRSEDNMVPSPRETPKVWDPFPGP